MNNGSNIFIGIFLALMLMIASGTFLIVDETQQVIITRFGKLVNKPITKAGLYFKVPFIDEANVFEKRLLQWDGEANEMPTKDKRFIWVDVTARWRIEDVLKYFQTVRSEVSAQSRLDDLIDASTRAVISNNNLVEVIRNSNRLIDQQNIDPADMNDGAGTTELELIKNGRDSLSQKILERAQSSIQELGIELVDVKIKRINYKQEVRNKVYERMISERKRAAEKFRSEGQGKRAEIEGQMVKELEQIQSEAYREAQEIKGKADAEAINIYANAYNKDPEFFSFIKTLKTYESTINKDTTFILSTDNEFFATLNGYSNE